MKVKLLKRLRKEASEHYYVAECVRGLIIVSYGEPNFNKFYNLREAKKECDMFRRSYILNMLDSYRAKQKFKYNRIY